MPWIPPLWIDYPFVPEVKRKQLLGNIPDGFSLLISCPVCSLRISQPLLSCLSLKYDWPVGFFVLWHNFWRCSSALCNLIWSLGCRHSLSGRWVPNLAVKSALLYWAPDPYIQLYTGWALLFSMLEGEVAFNQMPVNGGRWWTHCPYKATSQDSALAEHFYWCGLVDSSNSDVHRAELIFSPPHTNLPLVGFVSFASF